MSKVRVLFLGTPDFAATCLERMISDEHFDVVAVITQPDRPAGRGNKLQPSPVKQLALKAGLEVITPESVNTPEMLEKIKSFNADSAAVVAFGQILSQKFLDLFPHGCVNVHGSLLPRWRGAAPIQRALMAGDEKTGVCLQIVVKKLDAGAVLGQREIAVDDDMDAVELYGKLALLGADLLHIEYMDYLRGNLFGHEQDETQVTYASKIDKAEAKIDWSKPARAIFNHVRGLKMGPFAYAERAGEMLKIHKTRADESRSVGSAEPGEVIAVDANSVWIACGRGALELIEVQPASRAKMQIADYLRGYPLGLGDSLNT